MEEQRENKIGSVLAWLQAGARGKASRMQVATKTRSDQKSTELHIKNVKMSPAPGSWQNLPHHVFGEVMTMMGRERHQDIPKCSQVCQSWNVMMSQMTKYEKDTIRREAKNLAEEIQDNWSYRGIPNLPEITAAASLPVWPLSLLSTWPHWLPV